MVKLMVGVETALWNCPTYVRDVSFAFFFSSRLVALALASSRVGEQAIGVKVWGATGGSVSRKPSFAFVFLLYCTSYIN